MLRFALIMILLGFSGCARQKNNNIKANKDTVNVSKDTTKEPKNFESIHQLEYEKHKLKKKIKNVTPPQKIKF